METQLWENILKQIVGTGAVGALLLFAVWWLQRDNRALALKVEEKQAKVDAEREKRISVLEDRVKTCEADRVELHKQVSGLKDEITNIYKSRDARATAALNIPNPAAI